MAGPPSAPGTSLARSSLPGLHQVPSGRSGSAGSSSVAAGWPGGGSCTSASLRIGSPGPEATGTGVPFSSTRVSGLAWGRNWSGSPRWCCTSKPPAAAGPRRCPATGAASGTYRWLRRYPGRGAGGRQPALAARAARSSRASRPCR